MIMIPQVTRILKIGVSVHFIITLLAGLNVNNIEFRWPVKSTLFFIDLIKRTIVTGIPHGESTHTNCGIFTFSIIDPRKRVSIEGGPHFSAMDVHGDGPITAWDFSGKIGWRTNVDVGGAGECMSISVVLPHKITMSRCIVEYALIFISLWHNAWIEIIDPDDIYTLPGGNIEHGTGRAAGHEGLRAILIEFTN